MKEEDRKRFLVLMARMKVSLPSQMNLSVKEEALRADVFWEALKYASIEDVTMGIERACNELKWFPPPIEIENFIYEHNHQKYLRNQSERQEQIEWMEPTEAGKVKAKELIQSFYDKLNREDIEAENGRIDRFQQRRIELKKQAKVIDLKKRASGDDT
jgi:hypothetical protein